MLCRNCYREIPDGSKFCPECGAPTNSSVGAAGGNPYDPNDLRNMPPLDPGEYDRHTMGDIAESGNDDVTLNDVVMNPPMQQVRQNQQQGQTGLSIAAMIFGILTCTAFIGFILGVIDLAKNSGDGRKHGGSIFAVTWGGILIACLILRVYTEDHPLFSRSASSPAQQTETEYDADSYDYAPATDDINRSVDDSYNDTQTTDSSREQQESNPGVVDPKFKAALDSYEEFLDEYINFMKTYMNSNEPMAMLSEYTTYMTKYSELMQKLSELDRMQDQMSAADLAYYIDWNARIQKKILEISNIN